MSQPTLTQLADALEMSTLQLGLYADQQDAATVAMVDAHRKLVAEARGETFPPTVVTTHPALPSLRTVTVKLVGLADATMRECFLAAKRSKEGLTWEEDAELMALQRQAELRQQEADKKAEMVPEGRLQREGRTNPHD